MVNHPGVKAMDDVKGAVRTRAVYQPDQDTTVDFAAISGLTDFDVGTLTVQPKTPRRQRSHVGVISSRNAAEVIHGKQYVIPLTIALGIITESSQHVILIWNSDHRNTATISQIQHVNPTGTVLTAPTPPQILARDCDTSAFPSTTHTLTVEQDGPAVQNTQLIYTIGALVFTVEITGQRILAFNFLPNWEQGIKQSYRFQTVMSKNERLVEQRRPLITTPLRQQTANYCLGQPGREKELRKFLHEQRLLSTRPLAIPVYKEKITPTVDLNGLTVLPVNEDLTQMYDITNLTVLILVRKISDIFDHELKGVSAVGANSISVDVPVVGDFVAGDTLIYPCMIGIIESKDNRIETDLVGLATIDFTEIVLEET